MGTIKIASQEKPPVSPGKMNGVTANGDAKPNGLATWNPDATPTKTSLSAKNTPDATPGGSLRGGGAYKAKGGLQFNEMATALDKLKVSYNGTLENGTKLPKDHLATEVDDRDKNTPDKWVPRHPDLVRLTGKHPFNCEPPLSDLVDNGFITPVSLHYVRNHGKAASDMKWETHRVVVKGLVEKEFSFSMDEIVKMPSVSLPVTLVCAGNRRKEENMTKQTIGFSWGAAAVSTNIWKGVRLSWLLDHCGMDRTKARHVCFVGSKNEDLPNGRYGTSVDIATAMDPYGEVMLAYEANGMKLAPDHGYPIRMIIPGWIGGRMVKWLDEIVVSEKPSENHYHFYDNRIMPPHVDAELAKSEGWWFKPEYLFNELNINSAIAYPANGELLPLTTGGGSYTIKGYAYSGGGRKITRVELTFDGGKTWKLCNVRFPEEEQSHSPKFGKYYCWMFWEYTIDKFEFLACATSAGEFACRAWDEGNNTQPANLTWNLMGMGNNCHFRVKVFPRQSAGSFVLEFQHPTIPGPASGGWMPPPVKAADVDTKPMKRAPSAPALKAMEKKYTMEEIAKHNSDKSAWIVVDNNVYDATPFLKDHPGGGASIVMNSGADATEEFHAIHSDNATSMLEDYLIGSLDMETVAETPPASNALHYSKSSAALMKTDLTHQSMEAVKVSENIADEVALNPKKWLNFKLIEKVELSHDTRRFRFGLDSPKQRLGLPVGYHFFISAIINGSLVMRQYTPTSSDDDLGYFDLVIKVYFPNVHPKFPEGGKMSQHFESLSIEDEIKVKGPLGHFEYKGYGKIIVEGKHRTIKKLGLICGGTGITPAYQVMKAVAKNSDDNTEVHLVYANRSEKDILLREELEEMCELKYNIKIWYTIDIVEEEDWEYDTGFINENMLRKHIPAADSDSLVAMCGPKPMIDFACMPNLQKIGFSEDQLMCF